MKKQITYALLAALAISAFASCGSEPAKKPEDTKTKDTDKKTETTEPVDPYASYIDELPEDLDLGGRKFIFGAEATYILNRDVGPESTVGEIVVDSVYERNLKVMERLNCEIIGETENISWGEWSDKVYHAVLANEHHWDVVDTMCNGVLQAGRSTMYMNLAEVDYLDIEKEYWDGDSIMELSTDGSSYQLVFGEINLSSLLYGGCTFFNKDLYASIYEDPNELYQLANEGKWTLDVLKKNCEDIYHDLNASGASDQGDRMGLLVYSNWSEPVILEYGSTYQRIVRDEFGTPTPDFDMNKATATFEKLKNLLHETTGVLIQDSPTYAAAPEDETKFENGNVLFKISTFEYALGGARNLKYKWGMIPVPKFDEAQETYHGNCAGAFFALPLTTPEPDEVGALLEAMASESHENVIEQFYSEALMAKYSPDEEASKAIKLITDSIGVNFARSFNYAMQNLGQKVADCAYNGTSSFTSSMKATNKMGTRALAQYIENLSLILDN